MESHSDPKALSYGLYEVITLSNSQQLYCHCMCPSKTGLLMLGKRPHEFSSVMGFSLWSRCKTWREKRRRVWVLPFRHKFKCQPNPAPQNVLYDFCDYTRGPLYSIQHTFCHSTPCFCQWTKIALDPFMICTVQCFFLNKIFTEFALYSFQWGFDVTSFLSFEVSINAIVETC